MFVKLKYVLFALVLFSISATAKAGNAPLQYADSFSIEGRWDITVNMDGKNVPSWLEVRHSGLHTLTGHFVGSGGSARPVSRVVQTGNTFRFSLPPQWEQEPNDISFEGTVLQDSLSGTMLAGTGKSYTWTAVRTPALRRTNTPVWGKPIALLNGKDLSGWHALGENQWQVENGVLRSPKSGANLVTDSKFTDFKLHIEFRYQKGSNSGVYLRGRYEVQITDSKGHEPLAGELGAVYGFLTPIEQVAKNAGEWQTYDITLVGRLVTLVANGKTVICNQEIPGITGGAIDSREGEPGPILLQGDHGPIEYRNIVLTPAK
ncbi:MAG TPA: DUF1080 domain-containing protein [Chitinophagaceae bacterium]|nr:DUF1080 domain-containing protein [Chitinophagaceae bacterium]